MGIANIGFQKLTKLGLKIRRENEFSLNFMLLKTLYKVTTLLCSGNIPIQVQFSVA